MNYACINFNNFITSNVNKGLKMEQDINSNKGLVMKDNKEIETMSVDELTEMKVKEVLLYETEVMTEQQNRTFMAKERQAKIGMTFVREKNQNKRIENGQALRVIAMITNEPKIREEYIRKSMPKLLAAKK